MAIIDGMDESSAGRASARRALAGLDLNLVTHLDALLTERNVTRAAERLNLSQPAMSAALARLRTLFDDPLLVRRGRAHELSSLGARLAPATAGIIDGLHGLFGMTPGFDPAEEEREFVIHCSDHSAAVVGAVVRRLAAAEAPRVRLRFVHHELAGDESPGDLLARSDGALLPHGVLRNSPSIDVFDDRWVCIVADGNDAVGEILTEENLAGLPWVTTHHRPAVEVVIARQLAELGIEPRVGTVVDGFFAVPHFVSGTDSVAVVQQRLAGHLPPSLGVRTVAAPFELEPHAVALFWHPLHDDEPAHRWLRSLFVRASHEIPPLTGPHHELGR